VSESKSSYAVSLKQCALWLHVLIAGILGTQLYMGQLRQRCFPDDVRESYPGKTYEPEDELCALDGSPGLHCHSHYMCSQRYPGTHQYNPNLNEYQNFDNTANAFLSIFVIISLEGRVGHPCSSHCVTVINHAISFSQDGRMSCLKLWIRAV
jgi:hypothetical protein